MMSYSNSSVLNRRRVIMAASAYGLLGCAADKRLKTEAVSEEADITPHNKASAAGEAWSTVPSLPNALQEIYPCAHEGRLHLTGGFTAKDGRIAGATSQHQSWTPGAATWEAATPLPAARHHPHMISYQGRLLAFAGFQSPVDRIVWEIQNTGWALSEDGTVWDKFAGLPAPAAEAVVGITGDDALHLAGGRTWAKAGRTGAWTDHVDTDHHFVLTELSGKWERAAPCLHKRNSTAGGVIDGNLHIVGGRQVGGGNLDHHSVYNYKEDRWDGLAPLPQAQGGLAAASLGGKLYAFGGEFFDNGGGVYPEGWVYNPNRDQWDSLPDMPHPRHGLGAVTLGGAVYVIGGALQASGVETSALVEVYKP